MACRKLALIAIWAGLFVPSWAQSSSDSCYWTSTVLYGGQSTMQTFSSMNPPSLSSSPSSAGTGPGVGSSMKSGTVTTIFMSSTISTTDTPSVTPSILPFRPFIIQVVVSTTKIKRDTQYISFGGEFAILVDEKSSAAIFDLTDDGYLDTDHGDFVGPSSMCEDCKVALLKDEMPPITPPIWSRWFIDAFSLRYGDSVFCVGTNDQLFIVFGDGASDDCQGVSLVGELAAASSSASPNLSASSASLTAFPTTSEPLTSSSILGTTTAETSSSIVSPLQGSVSSPAMPVSSSSSRLPSSSTTLTSAATSTSTSSPATLTTHSSSSTTRPSIVSTSSSLQTSSSPSSPPTSRISTSNPSTTAVTSSSSSTASPSSQPSSSSSTSLPGSSSSSASRLTLASTITSSSSPLTSSTAMSSSRPSSSSSSTSTSSSSSSAVVPLSSSTSVLSSTSTSTSRSPTAITASTASPTPNPNILLGKRGLAYANVNQTYYYAPPTQVSWAYNYYYAPNSSSSRGIFPRTSSYPLRFIPLLFNDDPSLAINWLPAASYAIANYGADALFSFNEPDLCVDGSACMTVQRALVGYNRSMQPFAGQIRLVAPAITNAGSGFTWLRDFLGNVSLPQWNLTVDIVNIHWYASPYNMQYFIDYMTNASVIANGRPIWITEYGMDNSYYEPHVQQFMKNSTYWCDRQPFIERYAWFGNYPNNLLDPAGTALGPRGVIWNSYVGSNYVYGFPARVAGTVEEAREVNALDAGEVEAARAVGKDGDEGGWKREGFLDRMWWKGDGHMDGK